MITKEDIYEVANLSKLHIADDEIDVLCSQMQSIVDFASKVCNAPVRGESLVGIMGSESVFREDRIETSLPLCDVLKNSVHKEDGYFLLKR